MLREEEMMVSCVGVVLLASVISFTWNIIGLDNMNPERPLQK